ncbi:MAG: hypothetical protein ACRBDX_08770 [Gammaproteobacteria bacterium]
MAALSEKILWPIVGIFIFGVLAGFYIDDRRRLMQESTTETTEQQVSSNEHAGETADNKQASNEHAGKAAKKKPSSTKAKKSTSSNQATGATSMDINEYLAQSTNERNAELVANVTHHQGFHGGIDEYLSGSKSKKTMQAKASKGTTHKTQAHGSTSMSIDEYQAKTSDHASQTSGDSYHGGIAGYLAKYGNGSQTKLNKNNSKPFNKKEHIGFHGSYEDYAKKYN